MKLSLYLFVTNMKYLFRVKKKCLQLQAFSQLKLNKSLASPPTLFCYLAS